VLFFAASARASTLTNVQTVFLIVMENVNWSALKGNPSSPYINTTLVPDGVVLRAVLHAARTAGQPA
jgi:hypothetical protein